MEFITEPINEWPGEPTPTRERQRARFSSSYSATLDLLDRELYMLDAEKIVLQMALSRQQIRIDGKPIPEPLTLQDFSGKFVLRVPVEVHRKVAINAKRQGVSINQYLLSKISD